MKNTNERKGTKMNRFGKNEFVVVVNYGDGWESRAYTEEQVSNLIDMQDCADEEYHIYWVEPKTGELHIVTTGGVQRHEGFNEDRSMMHYGNSELVANGNVVGHVMYTDH